MSDPKILAKIVWQNILCHDENSGLKVLRSIYFQIPSCIFSQQLLPSTEGKSIACSYECKFIETSAAINHNVDELLVGMVSQIRLKSRQKEELNNRPPMKQLASPSTSPFKKGGSMKGSFRSSMKTKGLINRLLGKSGRSKSCDNLHVLWRKLAVSEVGSEGWKVCFVWSFNMRVDLTLTTLKKKTVGGFSSRAIVCMYFEWGLNVSSAYLFNLN